jgi:CTP:molybdopterin cytidylyltransferase MocA
MPREAGRRGAASQMTINGFREIFLGNRKTEQWPDVAATLLLVCDQPAVNSHLIERLIAKHQAIKKNIVASRYADTVGVPAIFDRSLFEELFALGDESGAKSVILQNRERVARFALPEGAIDIDTWEDWEKVSDRGHPEQSEGPRTN